MDNTNGFIREIERADSVVLAELTTLLGPKFKFPKAGVIRSGIMVPKSTCSADDSKLYDALVAEGRSWDEIEAKLGLDKDRKTKLIPKNVDYFSVFPGDCVNKENAKKLHNLYGDKDGKLRSFSVVFPVNEWWNILPHSLRCYGNNGLKFKSDFRLVKDRNGEVVDGSRVCTFPVDAVPGKKVFGGRAWDERPCDPEICSEYQSGDCAFGGAIQFYIPGIPGVGLWMLPTTSWYSLVDIKSSLELVSRITGNRITGTFGGKPIFRIRKVREEISRIDTKTGKAIKTSQWLIKLEADVDMTELAAACEPGRVISAGLAAANMLAPSVAHSQAHTENKGIAEQVSSVHKVGTLPGANDNGIEPESAETVASKASSEPSATVSEEKNGDKKLSSSAEFLWKSLAGVCKSKAEVKGRLRELCGVDSFFALTDAQARDALNKLTEQMLQKY
ncbi:MAG: hypothetical protein NUW09_01925 [Deltaproteobacteria bacterium]|nr:hypothetical protein [Deltaproteobacteria bacterium]